MGWSVAGTVLGVLTIVSGAILGAATISLIVLLCGFLATLLGILGMLRGYRKLGVAALVVGAGGLALGLVLLLLVAASSANGA